MQAIFIAKSRLRSLKSRGSAPFFVTLATAATNRATALQESVTQARRTASPAAWHSSAPVGQPESAALNLGDEGADDSVELRRLLQVRQMPGARDHPYLRVGDEVD